MTTEPSGKTGPLILTPDEWALCLAHLGEQYPHQKELLWRAGRMEMVDHWTRRLVAHVDDRTKAIVLAWLAAHSGRSRAQS